VAADDAVDSSRLDLRPLQRSGVRRIAGHRADGLVASCDAGTLTDAGAGQSISCDVHPSIHPFIEFLHEEPVP
jgi:hypothetical protein